MMPDYHIGTLDKASQDILAAGEVALEESSAPRATFLQSKVWTKAVLSAKKKVSADSKIFTFDLEHSTQVLGLPTGMHLMLRLRDPVTREAIIRSYTPISETYDQGKLHILIKVYYDTPERKGGKMTQALDAIPVGHFVEFKGPTGHFEYLGRGMCLISGTQRKVQRFIMICGGSGITPIFQVLRAVMTDSEDPTQCIVLNGNRIEEDILCRKELDDLKQNNDYKYKLIHSLSRPSDSWTGRRGRMDKSLFEQEIGPCKNINGEDLVLVCGPEALENSVRSIFKDMGWNSEDLLFF